jgi:hypothetical protein
LVFLNALKGFEEIDFNGSPNGDGASDYYGLDHEAAFEVDASLLNVKTLGVLAQLDDVSFANLSSKNTIIAKMGDGITDDVFMTPLYSSSDPYHEYGVEDTVHLNLQALRATPRVLDPMGDHRHVAEGKFVGGGEIKLEVQAGVNAIVTANQIGGTDSDYNKLTLSGEGHVSIGNNYIFGEEDSPGRIDNAVVDASRLTGGLYFQNDPDVAEKISSTYLTTSPFK